MAFVKMIKAGNNTDKEDNMNWTQQIADCIAYQRHLLKGVPLLLIASMDYEPDFIYWLEYRKSNTN